MIALNQLTDIQLVTIYQKNQDAIYFGELYNRYYKKVYHYCLGKVKNRDDAYDITADTFVKLIDKIAGLRNPELFIAWLFRIANNACMDSLNSRKQGPSLDLNAVFNIGTDDSEMEEVIFKEHQLNKLDLILDRLDQETKTLLVDKYFKKMSVEDLATNLGLSKSAVKMRLARGRNKIAEHFLSKQSIASN